MSKKRNNRNNKKVLQALRQKRAKGGRLKAYQGMGNIDFNSEYIQEQIAQGNLAAKASKVTA